MSQKNPSSSSNPSNTPLLLLWAGVAVFSLGLIFVVAVYPELTWLLGVVSALLVIDLGLIAYFHRKALKSRSGQFGIQSGVTVVLVIAIVGVINFFASKHPGKIDLTKNKIHTLSDQSSKLVKGLQKPLKAIYFGKLAEREKVKPLLDNLKGLSTKFEVEYVDPDKEPTRAKQNGIKKYNTLQLIMAGKDAQTPGKDQKIEDPNEEKITNTLIKLLKEKQQTFCAITGHGERSFSGVDAEGYEGAKKALGQQYYEVKEVNLAQETKVPDSCDAIAILGPTKAFFAPEVKALNDYLNNGGRALFALDMNLKGQEHAPELIPLLASWYVNVKSALIVDPLSKMLGVDAAVPIVASYSKEHPVTKDFQTNAYFPFARPLESVTGAPAGLNVQWLGQTTPKSWAESNMSSLSSGQVSFEAGQDKPGPLHVAMAVEGKQKDSKATRNTRLLVFGTSFFATNNYSRFGANMDLFMNAASWLLEDESLISIRAKEEGAGKVELSQKQGGFIFILTVILIPALIAISGIVIWVIRRKW